MVSLETAVKPLFFLLNVSGLYCSPAQCSRNVFVILTQILGILSAIACSVSLVLSLVGQLMVTAAGDVATLYIICYTLGEVYLLVVYYCLCRKAFYGFLAELEFYQKDHGKVDCNYRSVLIFGVIGVIVAAANFGRTVYSLNLLEMVKLCHAVYWALPEIILPLACNQVAFGSLVFFQVQLYCGAFILYITVCKVLKTEANNVVKNLTQLDKITLLETPEVIENFRLRHAHLCHVIEAATRFMTHFLAAFYGAGITCMLLTVHGVINEQLDQSTLPSMGTLFFSFTFYLIVITLTGVSLNLKMHEPVSFLFRLDVQRMKGKGYESVTTFLSRVQGAPIGFNVYSLFTVDSSTIMMICGTLVTYALVIIQFKPGTSLLSCASSTTEGPTTLTSFSDAYSLLANKTTV